MHLHSHFLTFMLAKIVHASASSQSPNNTKQNHPAKTNKSPSPHHHAPVFKTGVLAVTILNMELIWRFFIDRNANRLLTL